jgi:hypothetical protein
VKLSPTKVGLVTNLAPGQTAAGALESTMANEPLPRLLMGLLSRANHLKHLVLGDTSKAVSNGVPQPRSWESHPLTFGKGTENLAAFSALFDLIWEEMAL